MFDQFKIDALYEVRDVLKQILVELGTVRWLLTRLLEHAKLQELAQRDPPSQDQGA